MILHDFVICLLMLFAICFTNVASLTQIEVLVHVAVFRQVSAELVASGLQDTSLSSFCVLVSTTPEIENQE
jgi:tRNA threonylcarbamoyladenosine modification (KEOPS) complex Cgi121 subunit